MVNKSNNANYGAKPWYPIILHWGAIMMLKTNINFCVFSYVICLLNRIGFTTFTTT